MTPIDAAYFANLWQAANWISYHNRQSELIEQIQDEKKR